MSGAVEVLDPRHDPEPAYWRALRATAGLRADWDWDVLTAQAWSARTPQPLAVLHGASGPAGVVAAGWLGLPAGRKSFTRAGSRPRLGVLDVRSPGSSAVPGWWFAAELGVADLAGTYARAMRKELGFGCRGLLLRQVDSAATAAVGGRLRLVRRTEPVWRLDAAGWTDRDDWLRTLDKKRRSNLRVITRQVLADPRVEAEAGPGKGHDPVEVAALLRLNDTKYAGGLLAPEPQSTAYLAEYLRQPDVVTFGYRDRDTGTLLALGTVLDHPQWPVWRHWSMIPHDRGGVKNLYFHHVGVLVDWALSTGRAGLVLGKGKSQVKESLGATGHDQYALALPLFP